MEAKTYEEIATQIYQNIIKSKSADDNYLNNIIEIIRKQENLQEYITNVNRKDVPRGALYGYSTKTFTFYGKRLEKRIPKLENATLDDDDKKYYHYLQLTRLLLKEIELISELKEGEDPSKKDLKAEILRMSYCRYMNWHKEMIDIDIFERKHANLLMDRKLTKKSARKARANNEFGRFAPEEYYAQFSSYENILEITELLEAEKIKTLFFSEICEFLEETYRLTFATSKTTKKCREKDSPVLFYLEQLGCESSKRKQIKKEGAKLDSISRLKLGLEMNKIGLARIQTVEREVREAIKLQRTFSIPPEWLNFK